MRYRQPGVGEQTCNDILQLMADTLNEITLLVAMMAQEHGWETLNEEDLNKFCAGAPAEQEPDRD